MRAFLVYIDDWLSSSKISCMDAHEERGYFRLLLHEYSQPDCGLPDDDKVLAAWSKLGPQWWRETKEKALRINGMTSGAKLRACFELRDGRLVNQRLYREWLHQQEVRQARAETGRLGGRPRKNQLVSGEKSKRLSDEKANGKQNETNDVYVCVSPGFVPGFTEEENLTPPAAEVLADAERYDTAADWNWFRERYPNIPSEDRANQAFQSVVDSAETGRQIRAALGQPEPWFTSQVWQEGKIHNADTWLYGRMWNGRPAQARSQAERKGAQDRMAMARERERRFGRGVV